jgi:hypothetical protein
LRKAKNASEIAAVGKYQGIVSNAVLERRASIDKAVEAYRNGLANIINTNSKTINNSILEFKTRANEAFSKSKAECLVKMPSRNIRDNFNKSINEARIELENINRNLEAVTLNNLVQTRDEAIRLSESTYKLAIEKARADLLSVIK